MNLLQELQSKALAIPGLTQKLGHLERSIKKAESDKHIAFRQHAKEQKDVEKLENETFSAFLLKLVGRYDTRLEKEQREEIQAKLAYDKAATHLAVLMEARQDTVRRLSEMRTFEAQYQRELRSRRNLLSISDDAQGRAFLALEAKIAETITRKTEATEAYDMAKKAQRTAERALRSLESADNWATADMLLRGGILVHMAKYSHMDEAEEILHTLAAQLQELQEEMGDVHGMDAGNLDGLQGISSGERMVDFWFDNIFTDWSVKSKIGNNADEVRQIMRNLQRIQSALETYLSELDASLARLQAEEEALLMA